MQQKNEITGDEQLYIPSPQNLPELTGASDAKLETLLERFVSKLTDREHGMIASFEVTETAALTDMVEQARAKKQIAYNVGSGMYLQRRTIDGKRCIVLSTYATGVVLASREVE